MPSNNSIETSQRPAGAVTAGGGGTLTGGMARGRTGGGAAGRRRPRRALAEDAFEAEHEPVADAPPRRRRFVAGVELGSFARAADRIGRSTSAVSAQLRKLEEQAGTAIFRKAGRCLALTDAGETMLAYARRLLELNDEAAAAVHGLVEHFRG